MQKELSALNEIDLSLPVFHKPISRQEIIRQLKSTLDSFIPESARRSSNAKRVKFSEISKSIEHFEHFLDSADKNNIIPDEQLLENFIAYLETPLPGQKRWKRRQGFAAFIRRLINQFPSSILQRPLVDQRTLARLERIETLSKPTRDAFDQFLRDGRRAKKSKHSDDVVLSQKLLSPIHREKVVYIARRFLDVVGKTDILSMTGADVQTFIDSYSERGLRQTAINLLADLRCLMVNLQARGLIKNNPVEEFTEKHVNVADDFVDQEEIDKLFDFGTLDRDSFVDVRDRLLCLLCYDYALRIGETALLNEKDVRSSPDYVEIALRSEVQKGMGKAEDILLNCFPKTKALMERYLELREDLNADTADIDALILSFDGQRLHKDGCRKAIQRCCAELGMVTSKGSSRIRSHCLRHSFGTLNIEPLGISLSLSELQDRLRHRDSSLTKRVYVQQNPLLKRRKHAVRMNGNGNGMQASQSSSPAASTCPGSNDFAVPEMEGVRKLRELKLKITWWGLRKYGLANGVVERRGREYFLSRIFVDDLLTNWVTKEKVLELKGFKRSRLYYWAKERGIRKIMIGRVTLFRKEDLMKDLLG
ncbi:MAG: site-specific integrase [Kiritimatiellae bacterium]|nr:site-specific integrase [Kiritimatiellia bacterium]